MFIIIISAILIINKVNEINEVNKVPPISFCLLLIYGNFFITQIISFNNNFNYLYYY